MCVPLILVLRILHGFCGWQVVAIQSFHNFLIKKIRSHSCIDEYKTNSSKPRSTTIKILFVIRPWLRPILKENSFCFWPSTFNLTNWFLLQFLAFLSSVIIIFRKDEVYLTVAPVLRKKKDKANYSCEYYIVMWQNNKEPQIYKYWIRIGYFALLYSHQYPLWICE